MSVTKTSSQTSANKSVGSAAVSTPNIYLIAPDTVNQFANGSSTGGGAAVVVANVFVTNSTYGVLDDTAISTAGGYVKITGTGFISGCVAYMDGETSTSTTFVSSTEIRAQFGPITAGNTHVYVVNPDNSVGIKLNAVVSSGVPNWITETPLVDQVFDIAFQLTFSATSDSNVSYYVSAGNSVPTGTTLYSNGLFSGTVAAAENDTTYSFSVDAIDAENQETPKTFSITLRLGDANFYIQPLLITGSANTWLVDESSTNLTSNTFGDARPATFSPYNTNWSGYFDSSGDYVSGALSSPLGAGDFTIEFWSYQQFAAGRMYYFCIGSTPEWGDTNGISLIEYDGYFALHAGGVSNITVRTAATRGEWVHVAVVRSSGVIKLYYNGVAAASTVSTSYDISSTNFRIGSGAVNSGSWFTYYGYMSNFRVVGGTALYTTDFTPPTAKLSAVANTRLLALQDNRFIDRGNNSISLSVSGDTSLLNFSPFDETIANNGSGYFDGNGDYLSFANNSALSIVGNTDACIEFWLYPIANSNMMIVNKSGITGTSYPNYSVSMNTSKQIYFLLGNSGSPGSGQASVNSTSDSIKLNAWNHVVCTKNYVGGGPVNYYRIMINGVLNAYTSQNNPSDNLPSLLTIGFERSGTAYCNGYISNVRILNTSIPSEYQTSSITPGTVIYTVPTQPHTATANTTLLTLQSKISDNTIKFSDSAGVRNVVSRSGNASQGSYTPFSPAGWSQYGDGTGDNIIVSKSLSLTSDWCLECWFFHPYTVGAGRGLFNLGYTANYGLIMIRLDENVSIAYEEKSIHFAISLNGGTWNDRYSVSNAFEKGRWNHLVWTRQSGYLRGFINGKLLHTARSFSGTMTGTNHAIGQDATTSFPGYISNLRLQNGNIPVDYQTSSNTANAQIFTPPTAPLTANSTTSLLLCNTTRLAVDSSPTPATITTVNGDVRVSNFTPFKASGTGYDPVTHGGSGFFDGTGDNVIIPDSIHTELTAGDFCIEMMFYTRSVTGNGVLIDKRSGTYGPLLIWRTTSSIVAYMSSTNSSWNMVNGITLGTIRLGQWNHVALYRVGSAIYASVNGNIVTANASASGLIPHNNAANWYIGSGTNSADYFNGWISGVRIQSGTHSYTSTSCPIPTTAFSKTKHTKMLLEFNNSGLVDPTTRNNIETYGDARLTSTRSKFEKTSINLDGTGDYIVIQPYHPSIALRAGVTLTVEAWIYPITVAPTTSSCVIGETVISGTQLNWLVGFAPTNFKPYIQWYDGATKTCTATNAITTNTWSHVAWVITAGVITMYINGVAETLTGTTTLTTPTQAALSYLSIGNDRGNLWTGNMNDLRVTMSARYTSNFTPPSKAISR